MNEQNLMDFAVVNGIEPTASFLRFASLYWLLSRKPEIDRLVAIAEAWKA